MQESGVRERRSEKGRRVRIGTAVNGGTEVHCDFGGAHCEGFPKECDICAGWVGWGLEIKGPAKLITVTMKFDFTNVPPELLAKDDPFESMKVWVAYFKMDMKNDPDFGRYVKAEISIEEG
jgi:hypothetical protein